MAALYWPSAASGAALSHIQIAFNGNRRFSAIANGTPDLARACDKAIETINNTSPGGRGRKSLPDFAAFIRDLAEVFRNAGGRPSATTSLNIKEAGGRWKPFVRFAWTISQSLPEEVKRHTSKTAFADAVHNVLQSEKELKKKEGGK